MNLPAACRPTLVTRLSNTKLPAFLSREKTPAEDLEPHPSGAPRPPSGLPARRSTPTAESNPPPRETEPPQATTSQPQLQSHTSLGAESSVVSEDFGAELASAPSDSAMLSTADGTAAWGPAGARSGGSLAEIPAVEERSPKGRSSGSDPPEGGEPFASVAEIGDSARHSSGGSPTAEDSGDEAPPTAEEAWPMGEGSRGAGSPRATAESLAEAVEAYKPGTREPMGFDSRMPSFVGDAGQPAAEPPPHQGDAGLLVHDAAGISDSLDIHEGVKGAQALIVQARLPRAEGSEGWSSRGGVGCQKSFTVTAFSFVLQEAIVSCGCT